MKIINCGTKKSVFLFVGTVFFLSLLCNSAILNNFAIAQEKIGPTGPEQRLKWYNDHVAMKDVSIFKSLKWRFIGPEIMSGRITDIDVPAGGKFTFFAATASGGIWKTENEGTTWECVFEHAPSTSIGDIAISPTNPEIIWAGLGEANIFRSSYSGTGMYKSADGGKTWKHTGLTDSQHIGRIVIHPENPDIVYVAASGHEYSYNEDRGVYKTIDGGKTWKKILYINEKTGAFDLVMDPSDTEILYATMWDRIRHAWNDPKPGDNDGIHKTTDGGKTWKKLTKGLPDLKLVGRIGVDVSRTNPDVIYALLDNHNPGRKPADGERDAYGRVKQAVIRGAEVYKSENKGESWEKVSESTREMEGLYATYGWVFGQIRVDPGDENTVFIMGVPLMKSVDGGKTFKSSYYSGLHGDHHAMWIDPENSNYIINGNDGGVNISYDGGKTWKNFEAPGVVQFYNVAVDMAKPFNVYGSIQDNGTWMGPVTHRPGIDPKHQWKSMPGGEASYIAIDPSDPNTYYSESFYGRIQRSDLSGPVTTKRIVPRAEKGEPPLRGNWLAPFIISPHNPYIIYHGMQYLFRSLDKGDNWERISPDLTYNDPSKQGDIPFATITTISESPYKFGHVYVGTDDGKVHVTKDGGKNWKEIMNGLPFKKWVSRIAASKYDENTVYVSLNGYRDDDFAAYIYKSTDCGNTWTDIKSNIPCGPVNVIREDHINKNLLYAGTDLGVYVTVNGGKDWQILAAGLPTTFVHDLVVHPRDNILVAATHGRGMYVADVGCLQKCTESVLSDKAHLFEVKTAKLPAGLSRWARRTAKNAEFNYFLQEPQDVEFTIIDEDGNTVRKLTDEGTAGLNKFVWDLTKEKTEKMQRPAFIKPGKYLIKFSAADLELKEEFEVKRGRYVR